ncbi:hypothetical protein AAGG49_23050, partial [Stenotrophomonas maltophilia]|uniref:hypothetical protein n=1 Tax=Stenotrophomonas maltophilia TaxID=40324 RepID=UPI00313D7BD2
ALYTPPAKVAPSPQTKQYGSPATNTNAHFSANNIKPKSTAPAILTAAYGRFYRKNRFAKNT